MRTRDLRKLAPTRLMRSGAATRAIIETPGITEPRAATWSPALAVTPGHARSVNEIGALQYQVRCQIFLAPLSFRVSPSAAPRCCITPLRAVATSPFLSGPRRRSSSCGRDPKPRWTASSPSSTPVTWRPARCFATSRPNTRRLARLADPDPFIEPFDHGLQAGPDIDALSKPARDELFHARAPKLERST